MKLGFVLILFALLGAATAKNEAPDTKSQPTLKDDPDPVPNDAQKEYMALFMNCGFDITKNNLFDYQLGSTQQLKPIFSLEFLKSLKYVKKDKSFIPKLKQKQLSIDLPISVDLYVHQSDLNPLLDATVAVLNPGNYSYQLHHSTYFGRVSGDTIVYFPIWDTNITDVDKEILTQEFIDDAKKLFDCKNYTEFLAKYGTHYFSNAYFGGMFRMQTHVNHKFVKDVSVEQFEVYLLNQTLRAFDDTVIADIPYDFYYHNHYDNSSYGGDKTINVSTPEGAVKLLGGLETNEIVPTNFEFVEVFDLMNVAGLLPKEQIDVVVEGLERAIQNKLDKFKVQSYMEAMDVVRNNPYGRSLGGCFDAQFLYSYFEGKLKEANVTLDDEFDDNAWAAEHNAQAILNRRAWFEKPYPPYPTTLAPIPEPTKSNATAEVTSTVATTKKS